MAVWVYTVYYMGIHGYVMGIHGSIWVKRGIRVCLNICPNTVHKKINTIQYGIHKIPRNSKMAANS